MIEFLLGLTFWPVILFGALFGALASSAYRESAQFATIVAIVASLIAWFFYDVNVAVWIFENPGRFFGGTLLYLSIGAMWSVWKWRCRLSTQAARKELKAAKKYYTDRLKEGDDPDGWLNSPMLSGYLKPHRNKDAITSWILLWPFSVVFYFLGEFVAHVIGRIYDALTGIYNRMTLQAGSEA